MVPYVASRSPEHFVDLLDREGVTILSQTPSAFRNLRADAEGKPAWSGSPCRHVFAGESLDLQSIVHLVRSPGAAHPPLINMYGITETTIHSTYREVGPADLGEGPGHRPALVASGASTSSTPSFPRCRCGLPARSSWAVKGWPAAIWAGRI